jgi:hypothetical protein
VCARQRSREPPRAVSPGDSRRPDGAHISLWHVAIRFGKQDARRGLRLGLGRPEARHPVATGFMSGEEVEWREGEGRDTPDQSDLPSVALAQESRSAGRAGSPAVSSSNCRAGRKPPLPATVSPRITDGYALHSADATARVPPNGSRRSSVAVTVGIDIATRCSVSTFGIGIAWHALKATFDDQAGESSGRWKGRAACPRRPHATT